ncbi:MAG: hypothetical protein K1X64_14625 [Myxococcaceae bacterium]|nr:hypothetical protein [Myxococcaceae bacterium]
MRHRRTLAWLFAAAVLLGLVGWLAPASDQPSTVDAVKPRVPRYLDEGEYQRLRERVAKASPENADAEPALAPTPHAALPKDPLIAALPTGDARSAMVIEANALWHSDLREPMLNCLFAGEKNTMLTDLADAGFDIGRDLDRFAVMDNGAMLTGNFENFKGFDQVPLKEHGPHTRVGTMSQGTGAMAVWKNQLIVFGNTEEQVLEAVSRIESGKPVEKPVLNDRDTYGDVYGRIDVGRFGRLAGTDPAFKDFFEQVQRSATAVSFHVDASHDVGLSLELEGNQSEEAQQLRKTLAGAIALGRVRAKAMGDERLFQLLDFAQVNPAQGKNGAQFSLDLALPHAFVLELLKECAQRESRRANESDAP